MGEGGGVLARVTDDAATAKGGGRQAGKEEGRGREGGKRGEGKERKGKGREEEWLVRVGGTVAGSEIR